MSIYTEFNKLSKNDSTSQIKFLEEVKNSDSMCIDDKGWVYWNLSDIYAVMRQHEPEYYNHVEFVEWGKKNLDNERLHWFVSDATQALTLSLGHHFDEWFEWYLYACNHSSKNDNNRGARFESHRAAIGSLLKLNKLEKVELPLNYMHELICENKNWENILFAQLAYYGFILEKSYKIQNYDDINAILDNVTSLISGNVIPLFKSDKPNLQEMTLLGSWDYINTSRDSKQSMIVSIHNLACTLNRIERFNDSLRLFNLAIENGLNFSTAYGLALYLQSLWKVNNNKEEVNQIYRNLSHDRFKLDELYKFIPELREILG